MMGARRWPKSAVELPPGQLQFGRPPTHQAGLVILGDCSGATTRRSAMTKWLECQDAKMSKYQNAKMQ